MKIGKEILYLSCFALGFFAIVSAFNAIDKYTDLQTDNYVHLSEPELIDPNEPSVQVLHSLNTQLNQI